MYIAARSHCRPAQRRRLSESQHPRLASTSSEAWAQLSRPSAAGSSSQRAAELVEVVEEDQQSPPARRRGCAKERS